jgi:hypothetical protein
MVEAIRVQGLSEFSRNLRRLDSDLPKALRIAFNQVADIVVADARTGIPTRTGKAKASVRARSTRTAARIVSGGRRAPYFPWLDFGGRVGRNRSVRRPFLSDGRYVYRAFYDNVDRLPDLLESALLDVVRQAGIEVD